MHNPWALLSLVNPQRENGHRRINNEIWAAMVNAGFSGSVYQVVMYVIDRTWGYDKLEEAIGYSQICKATRLSRSAAIKAVQSAEEKRVLVVEHGDTKKMQNNRYLFNKYYDTWLTSVQNDTSGQTNTITSVQNDTTTSVHARRKVSYATENIQKTESKDISVINKKKKINDPDRFVKGKHGHLVCRTADDVKKLKASRL